MKTILMSLLCKKIERLLHQEAIYTFGIEENLYVFVLFNFLFNIKYK